MESEWRYVKNTFVSMSLRRETFLKQKGSGACTAAGFTHNSALFDRLDQMTPTPLVDVIDLFFSPFELGSMILTALLLQLRVIVRIL